MKENTDLDVMAPEQVEKVLRASADKYREAALELPAVWGDPEAGRIWSDLATILERAAKSCERACARRLG